MKMFWIGLVSGFVVGGTIGYALAALMVANAKRDGRQS